MSAWAQVVALCLLSGAMLSAEALLRGRVTDENQVAVGGAAVSLQPAGAPADAAKPVTAVSGPNGEFAAELPPGQYRITVEHEGYFPYTHGPIALTEHEQELTIELARVREVRESVNVSYSPPTIDLEQAAATSRIESTDILFVPYPSSHSLKNAMRALPGAIVQDTSGELHLDGGAANQTLWTLDGFNVTDPITGRFDSQLNVEAVRSVTHTGGRYTAEHGKGSAGTVAIDTEMGDDRWRHSLTNFVPGFENQKGFTIGDWRPRAKLSGPVRRGRAWFSTSFDVNFSRQFAPELPKGEDRTHSVRLGNFTRVQVNLTNANILQGGLLSNVWQAPRDGLSVFDRRETTIDRRSRQWFVHLKDQQYFANGWLLEAGYGQNRTFGREIPQGRGFFVITPFGRRGNYFVDAKRWARRDQVLLSAVSPALDWLGEHRLKLGADWNRLAYTQVAVRTGFERRGLENELLQRVTFGGDGNFRQTNTEVAWYVQDHWRLRPHLHLELGLRSDGDRVLSTWATSPRVAAVWGSGGTRDLKITGGFGIVHDATYLRTYTRHLDQFTLTTPFDRLTGAPQQPTVSRFVLDGTERHLPRYRTASFGIEKKLPGGWFAKAHYLRKRGIRGLTWRNILPEAGRQLRTPPPGAPENARLDSLFALRNDRRDRFDALELTMRKTFRERYMVLASYTRSRALSNAALDISIDNPSRVEDNFGPMPWDAPNRFVSWLYLPLTEKWAFAQMLEWRTGFPFSVETIDGAIVGPVNSHRFPDFLEWNVSIERKLSLLGHYWAIRGGFFNVLDRQNPTAVNNVAGSPEFLRFAGGAPRAFVTRIRWLGRK